MKICTVAVRAWQSVPLALAVVALSACQQAAPPPTPTSLPAPTAAPAATVAPTAAASAEFDRLFIDMMVPHHQGAIEMARLAQERAERPEIKQLAADILSSQDS